MTKICVLLTALCTAGQNQELTADLSTYDPACGVAVKQVGQRLVAEWPAGVRTARLVIDLRAGQPLFESVGLGDDVLLHGVQPVTFLTVGTRQASLGRPPEMSMWSTFFDKPGGRPYQTYLAKLDLRRVRVGSEGKRVRITLGDVTAGPFAGALEITLYAGSGLVQVEAVLATEEDGRAILYDAGLAGADAGWRRLAWLGLDDKMQRLELDGQIVDRPLAVRHRAVIAECERGSVACFSPPHQYHFPRDWTDNLKFAWCGRDHLGHVHPTGLGMRQVANGGRAFEPWFNGVPKVKHRLGVFYLLSAGDAGQALDEVRRYTHGDRFVALPGHITYTHHYHMAVAVQAMVQKTQETPEFVRVFKDLGVNVLHLADFHGDGHPQDPGPLRLPELEMLFRECARLSERDFLLLPGEEINDYLGVKAKGKHPGHWMSLFPRPVYWTQVRRPDQPLLESHPRYGNVYHVGSRADMIELLRREHGLAWTSHPRIKASTWAPDTLRHEDFYAADYWVGAGWKHMPGDLSQPRLGRRALDVLDDMANWGGPKYLLGEVDVFKVDRSHEIYGHMNVNYVRLDKLPRYEQGWQPLLDALQAGKFFVTTGEIVLRAFDVAGKQSGETLTVQPGNRPELRVELEWTFPLRFAEVISGDGKDVFRDRIDLADTTAFGTRTLTLRPELQGRKWARFEVWDVAANGAFTQPVWLKVE